MMSHLMMSVTILFHPPPRHFSIPNACPLPEYHWNRRGCIFVRDPVFCMQVVGVMSVPCDECPMSVPFSVQFPTHFIQSKRALSISMMARITSDCFNFHFPFLLDGLLRKFDLGKGPLRLFWH